jgi:hypothetical protein
MLSLKADLSENMGVVHSISDFRATISYTVPALGVESPSSTNRICPRLPKKWPLEKNSCRGGTRGTVIAKHCAEVGSEKSFRTYFDSPLRETLEFGCRWTTVG